MSSMKQQALPSAFYTFVKRKENHYYKTGVEEIVRQIARIPPPMCRTTIGAK
jgi:hypothetical protein